MQCCCQHRPHDTLRVTLLPPAAAWCGYNSCLFVKSEKKFKFWTDPQYNEIEISSVKITEYAIIAMRGVDCVTLTDHWGPQVWDIVTAENLKYPLYSGWCIGISVDSLQASDWSLWTNTALSLADRVMDLVYTWYKGENDEFKKCLGG